MLIQTNNRQSITRKALYFTFISHEVHSLPVGFFYYLFTKQLGTNTHIVNHLCTHKGTVIPDF